MTAPTEAAMASILTATDHSRPADEVLSRFRNVPAAHVGDAQERLWVMDGDIGPMWPGATCTGTALPIYTQAGDNLAIHRAIDLAQPGDVLVINGHGDHTRALIGGLIARRAHGLGVAGIVIDGAVRDVDEFESIGLAIFARVATPAGPYKNGPGEIGFPTACGGVVCSAGDIIVGDTDGVVVVPQARAATIADAVDEVSRRERELSQRWASDS